jgi:hypothetical protein
MEPVLGLADTGQLNSLENGQMAASRVRGLASGGHPAMAVEANTENHRLQPGVEPLGPAVPATSYAGRTGSRQTPAKTQLELAAWRYEPKVSVIRVLTRE